MPHYDAEMVLIVDWCAKEVHRQGDSALYVPYMYRGWALANSLWGNKAYHEIEVKEHNILDLGGLVKNDHGLYRQNPVAFANGNIGVHHNNIKRSMENLLLAQQELNINEFIYEFLKIHPFRDGNGRVASILYNAFCGTLMRPVPLPEYKF